MKTETTRKPDPRLKPIRVYVGEEERATIQSHAHAIDSNCSEFLRRAGLRVIAEYRAEQAAASGMPAPHVGRVHSGHHAPRIASAHQKVIRYPGRGEGTSAGPGRAFSFPGAGVRRVQRGALRPMRS